MGKRFWIDVTSWVRGPYSSVGLCGHRLLTSMRHLRPSDAIEAVSRVAAGSSVRRVSLMEKLMGDPKVTYYSVDPVLAPMLRSQKCITVHDTWTLQPNPYQSETFQKKQRPRFLRALNRADRIVVPSQYTCEKLIQFQPSLESKISVIPWGPLLETEALDINTQSDIHAYLKEQRPFILSVGNLEYRKNHKVLFEAFLSSNSEVDLILVGGRGYGFEDVHHALRGLQETVLKGQRVHWFSGISNAEITALYKRASLVVQPSLEEGFGLPALEAMALGAKLLLSDIPPFREIAESYARYVSLNVSGKVWGQAIDEALSEDTVSSESSQYLDWEEVARRYLEVLDQC